VSPSFDIAIVGSGFGGSLLAMIARRLGRSVLLLERGQHPRFAIGESSTPLANLLLEEMARRYELPRLLPLAKWGTWQQNYPEIGCGLKRGFSFYRHTLGAKWTDTSEHRHQLLVAASPTDRIADTHWYRPDFDHFLVREAQATGAEYLDQVQIEQVELTPTGVALRGKRQNAPFACGARFLVDATGPRGCLHRAWSWKEIPFGHLPPTQGLYSHFTNVRRMDDVCPPDRTPPYPVDDAALHHIFNGGWIWVLRFNNGITSAGVAARTSLADQLRFEEGAPAWERLLGQLPTVREQFADAKAQIPFIHSPQLAFRAPHAAGPNWALLPSAAGFVDPLLSTGFPLTLLGIERLANILERDWGCERFAKRLDAYGTRTLEELDSVELMVAALYANLDDFSTFSALSLLYFAAATFSETARRLNRPELAGQSFLLGTHPLFGPRSRECFTRAVGTPRGPENKALVDLIRQTVEPVDVAGLGDTTRQNWFPVNVGDLLKAAPKLNASEAEIRDLLARLQFEP
jgi:FADH2 O2-dependent halogenase